MDVKRVTVTLPADLVAAVDRMEKNRSRFVLEAVKREVARRRREEFLACLENPHPETAEWEALGFEEWADRMRGLDADDLVDPAAATPVRWIPGTGWVEG